MLNSSIVLEYVVHMVTDTIPKWKISGGFFDVYNCSIPCPCEFAQSSTYGDCDGVLAWHSQKGNMVKYRLIEYIRTWKLHR